MRRGILSGKSTAISINELEPRTARHGYGHDLLRLRPLVQLHHGGIQEEWIHYVMG
jgi:hypothetical protein